MRLSYFFAVPAMVFAGLVFGAPTAAADCMTTGNMTFCSAGDLGDSGPYMPYMCRMDPFCNEDYNFRNLF